MAGVRAVLLAVLPAVVLALAAGCGGPAGSPAPGTGPTPPSTTVPATPHSTTPLPDDLCASYPQDEVLAILGLPGPGFTDATVLRLAAGPYLNDPDARVCAYLTPGRNLVRFSMLRGITRPEFESFLTRTADQTRARRDSWDGDLPGVADVASSARATDGEVMVFALSGDVKIQAGARGVPAAKLGELIKRMAADLHRPS